MSYRVQLDEKQVAFIRKQFDKGEHFTSAFNATASDTKTHTRVNLIFKNKALCESEHHYKFTAIDGRGRPLKGEFFPRRLVLYFEYQ
jgi:hypothetical protein